MKVDEFPIGSALAAVSVVDDQEFGGDELCLDQIDFFFGDQQVTLKPDPDTDEVQLFCIRKVLELSNTTALAGAQHSEASTSGKASHWYSALVGKTLEAVWVCENNQGYQDQVIFAFDSLHPTLAFVAEGSVLKVFRYEQLCRTSQTNGSSQDGRFQTVVQE
jgi:hypothetical protein